MLHEIYFAALSIPVAFVQDQPAGGKTFEVVSIKPADPDSRQVEIGMSPGGRFTASGMNLRLLLQQAFGIRDFQISGAPNWARSDRYVISAKGEDGQREPTSAEIRTMLQGVLTERFQLIFHRETKEGAVYSLALGKNGPKLRESEASGGDRQMMRMGRGQINVQGGDMAMLVNQLSNALGKPVLDKTGLTGSYDFKLEWTPDGGGQAPIRGASDDAPPADTSGPTIFTALQEQLGLKLDAGKGPVEFLVIDKVEKPTGN
jgi:bla regulator protein BlaR1